MLETLFTIYAVPLMFILIVYSIISGASGLTPSKEEWWILPIAFFWLILLVVLIFLYIRSMYYNLKTTFFKEVKND